MKREDRNLLKERLSALKGMPLRTICRNYDSLFMSFGEMLETEDFLDRDVDDEARGRIMVGEYAVWIEAAFRFLRDGEIFATRTDFFAPSSRIARDDVHFDYTVEGSNLWDETVADRFAVPSELVVKSVKINELGDLTMNFTNGMRLEVFVYVSTDDECWRFLRSADDQDDDLVVTGQGLWHDDDDEEEREEA